MGENGIEGLLEESEQMFEELKQRADYTKQEVKKNIESVNPVGRANQDRSEFQNECGFQVNIDFMSESEPQSAESVDPNTTVASVSTPQSVALTEIEPQPELQSVTPTEAELTHADTEEKMQKKAGRKRSQGDGLFYFTMIFLVIVVMLYGGKSGGAPKSFAGFSVFTVLTSSMQSEIPQGSLVITKQTDADALEIGDDITYLLNFNTTVTHRIVGIYEDYNGTGQRAFQTQGIMNSAPDKLPVPTANVVGKVVFHNLTLGKIVTYITENMIYIIVFLVIFAVSFAVVKKLLNKKG